MPDPRYDEFIEALTAKLNEAGVPAMPSWPDAIDWLIERARGEWCGLCGSYGAMNAVTHEPAPCIGCGRKSYGPVLTYIEPRRPDEPQRGGLRLVEGVE